MTLENLPELKLSKDKSFSAYPVVESAKIKMKSSTERLVYVLGIFKTKINDKLLIDTNEDIIEKDGKWFANVSGSLRFTYLDDIDLYETIKKY